MLLSNLDYNSTFESNTHWVDLSLDSKASVSSRKFFCASSDTSCAHYWEWLMKTSPTLNHLDIICKHDTLTNVFQISKLFPSLLLILPSDLGFQLYSVQMCLLFTFKSNTDLFYSHLPHSGCHLSGVFEQFILCLILLKRKMNLNTLHVMLWESTFSSCHFYPLLSLAPLTSNALKNFSNTMLFSSFSFSLPSTPGLYYVDQLGLLPSNRENKGENGRVAHTIPLGTVDSV